MLRTYSVHVTLLAQSDLQAIYGFLAVESEPVAELVYGELLKAILSLKRLPERFVLSGRRRLRQEGIRIAFAVSYGIYYVVGGMEVRVLRVWHAARRPPSGLKK